MFTYFLFTIYFYHLIVIMQTQVWNADILYCKVSLCLCVTFCFLSSVEPKVE
jgi:uncharacterized MnhB-related membrane protein